MQKLMLKQLWALIKTSPKGCCIYMWVSGCALEYKGILWREGRDSSNSQPGNTDVDIYRNR